MHRPAVSGDSTREIATRHFRARSLMPAKSTSASTARRRCCTRVMVLSASPPGTATVFVFSVFPSTAWLGSLTSSWLARSM